MHESMKKYFDRFFEMWKDFKGTDPQISFDPDCDPRLYCGEMDEDEYVTWRPQDKDIITDLSKIEDIYHIKLHEDIIAYFNSYWFLEMIGFCGTHNISLLPVIPSNKTTEFEVSLKNYYEANGNLDYIPIGFDATTFQIVALENNTGNVFLIDSESNSREFFFASIEELINHIGFKRV